MAAATATAAADKECNEKGEKGRKKEKEIERAD